MPESIDHSDNKQFTKPLRLFSHKCIVGLFHSELGQKHTKLLLSLVITATKPLSIIL